METDFNPLTTAHIDLLLEEFTEIKLEADKFELWFQPVYDLLTAQVLHNEVLVRWRDHKGELRQPRDLQLVLQDTQLLTQLDRIVVEKSIQLLVQQPKIKVSINLSNEIFADDAFPEQLHKWLQQYQVEAKRIALEIEEETILQNFSKAIALMTELQAIGCPVVIDNFSGRGFTFQQFQELPIVIIKLHPSFSRKTLTSSQKQLAKAIAHSCNIFQKQCIFKGIEDNFGLKLANDLGAKGAQGYSLSRPQNKPKTLGLIGLLIFRILIVLIFLYIFKSLVGINLDHNRHAWEVIMDFFQSLFDGK